MAAAAISEACPGSDSSGRTTAASNITRNDTGVMARCDTDAGYQWLAGSIICSRQSAVWVRSMAKRGSGAVASNAVDTAAKRETNSGGGSGSGRQSVIRSELGLGSSQSVASDRAGFTGEKAFARNTRPERRQSAPCDLSAIRLLDAASSLMATAADTAAVPFTADYCCSNRQSAVRSTAALALGRPAYSGSSPIRALYSAGGDCNSGQSAVSAFAAVERFQSVAGPSFNADCSGATDSRVYCSTKCGQSPLRDASGLALWGSWSMADRYTDANPPEQARAGVCCGSTAAKNDTQFYYYGQSVGTDRYCSTKAALSTAAVCYSSSRQSAVWDASGLALFGSNRRMEAGRATAQAVTEDSTGWSSSSDCARPKRKAQMEA